MGTKLAVPDQPLEICVLCTTSIPAGLLTHVIDNRWEGAEVGFKPIR